MQVGGHQVLGKEENGEHPLNRYGVSFCSDKTVLELGRSSGGTIF